MNWLGKDYIGLESMGLEKIGKIVKYQNEKNCIGKDMNGKD